MRVTVIADTPSPMDVIGIAAGMCYGKPTPSPKRVRRCAKAGHMSVFEHASATLIIEGISRACLAQLTRHRIESYSVTSQRYCEMGKHRQPPRRPHRRAHDCARPYRDHAHGARRRGARLGVPRVRPVLRGNVREL